ncbi:MAG: hypothetical protein PHI28_04340 [Mangrovibacterium sp.]|nr:hypothetical protein [Mangrovibacterium sp.]
MYLRGKRYETEKKIAGAPIGNNNARKQSMRDAHLVSEQTNLKTTEKMAKEYGVNQSTITRDAQYARAVDAMPPDTKEKILYA